MTRAMPVKTSPRKTETTNSDTSGDSEMLKVGGLRTTRPDGQADELHITKPCNAHTGETTNADRQQRSI